MAFQKNNFFKNLVFQKIKFQIFFFKKWSHRCSSQKPVWRRVRNDLTDVRAKNLSNAGSQMTSQMFEPKTCPMRGPKWNFTENTKLALFEGNIQIILKQFLRFCCSPNISIQYQMQHFLHIGISELRKLRPGWWKPIPKVDRPGDPVLKTLAWALITYMDLKFNKKLRC